MIGVGQNIEVEREKRGANKGNWAVSVSLTLDGEVLANTDFYVEGTATKEEAVLEGVYAGAEILAEMVEEGEVEF